MIDFLIPVLGRPENARRVFDSIQAHTSVDHTINFICTHGDSAEHDACKDLIGGGVPIFVFSVEPNESGDYSRKTNQVFPMTRSPYVFNGADDLDFQPGWDTRALRAMRGNIGVVATNDKANREVQRGLFGTHCLISRAYIEAYGGTFDGTPGVVLYEGYDHCYVDRELCEAAKTRGAYAFASNSVVKHRHPLWRTAPWDDTYRRAVARAREDAVLFDERLKAWNTSGQRDIVSR